MRHRGIVSRYRPLVCVALLPLLAACADRDAQQAPGTDSGAPATPATSPMAGDAEGAAAARGVRLTMDGVRGYVSAAENLHAAAEANPELRARMDAAADAEAEGLDEIVREIEQIPEARRAIEQAGMSARDYAVFAHALGANYGAVLARDAGVEVAAEREWITEENMEFVARNRAEIDRLIQRLQQLTADLDDDE